MPKRERKWVILLPLKGSMDLKSSLVLSLALATVPTMLTALIGIPINNSRLGDVKSPERNCRILLPL